MAFSTSNSIFGKPATGSAFGGQTTVPKSQGSLFGNAVPNISSFGSQTQSQQPTQNSNMFGGQQQQQQAPQPIQPPSLFGQTPQNAQQSGASSLFGNTQQSQQNSGFTNPFAQQAQSQPQGQNQPNPVQPSSFGAPSGTSNNIFGGAFTGNPLLGNSAQNAPNASNTLFGGASTSAPFGGASTNTNPLFGNRQQSQPAMSFTTSSAPGAPPFTKSTRFNDLPESFKKMFEDIDAHIQGRIQISNDLKQRKLGDEANKGKELIRDVHKDLLHTISVIQSDQLQTRSFKANADQTVQDTIITTRIVDGYRNPQQGNVHLNNHAEFPLEFFARTAEEMQEKLAWCKDTIEAIERKLSSVASQSQITPQAITTTLEAQHTSFITLASRIAAADAELQKVKALYTQLWRAKTGSMRDPFNALDRGTENDFGLEGLGTHGK